jgi:hypothetical protein
VAQANVARPHVLAKGRRTTQLLGVTPPRRSLRSGSPSLDGGEGGYGLRLAAGMTAGLFPQHSLGKARQVSRSAAQRAENESTFRRANEDLEQKAQAWSFGEQPTPYLCECEDPLCTEVVMLARSEYEAVRSDPRRFFIVPGHDAPQDRLIDESDEFSVVEKTGKEGVFVEEQDPRS